MASLLELVTKATQTLNEQRFCDEFIRKYSAIWRKLLVFAQKHRIEEFSWDLARAFLREEYSIDIEGEDIYVVENRKLHYTTVRPLLYILLLQYDVGWIRTQKLGAISLKPRVHKQISSCRYRKASPVRIES